MFGSRQLELEFADGELLTLIQPIALRGERRRLRTRVCCRGSGLTRTQHPKPNTESGRENLKSGLIKHLSMQNVIDGDLCEQYNSIDPAKQKSIAEDLDRNPSEVSKKLEDIRTRYAF